jgi:hypothetical protein
MAESLNVSRFLQRNNVARETIIGLSGQVAYRTNIRVENEIFSSISYRDYLANLKNLARADELDLLFPGQTNRIYASQEEYLIQLKLSIPEQKNCDCVKLEGECEET